MSLDGFSMYPLVKELNHALVGGRIDKISQPNKQTVLLSIRQPGRNHSLHISINPQNAVVNLNERTLENPPEPPVFCMVLRKQIEGGRIADIRQHSLDRIILIDIDVLSTGGIILTKTLIIELMGKYSNIILICDGIIIDSLRKVGTTSSRVRLVLPGLSYSLPPNQDKFNVLDEPPKNILATIKEFPNLKLSKALLNTCLGFGPVTAKEIAFSAGLPANMLVSDLKEADGAAILNALQKIITAFLANDIHPTIVMDTHRKLLAMASFALHTPENAITQTFPSVSIMLDYSVQLSGNYVVPDKDRFKKLVHNELARAKNKINILTDELATAQKAEDYKIKADNLMTYQYTLKDHANKEITVSNIYSETNETLAIALDTRISVIKNMQSYYRKYDKFKRAQSLLLVQINECRAAISYLTSIETSLDISATLAEINDIKTELITQGYLKEKTKKKSTESPSAPFKFQAPDGTTILVGKNNYQNDILTFKTAQRTDIWLHTKDIPGSHVIIRCDSRTPSTDTLLYAANLAAHFSQAKGSSKIPVDYTLCHYVKKTSGAKPGFVIFTNQKTLYVTPNEEDIERFLEKLPH